MSQIRQRALAFMASRNAITLATVGLDGLLISPASYVMADDFDFWFIANSNERFDSVTAAAGIIRSDATEPDDIEVRVEGTIELVNEVSEQAKAFSAFLMHGVAFSDGQRKLDDSRVLTVYRMKPRRIHVSAPSLLRHTAVFHVAIPDAEAEAPSPRSRSRKFKPIRARAEPSLPGDTPTRADTSNGRRASLPPPS